MATKISQERRAAAIADLMAGEQPAIVAERHGIDQATVRSWKSRYVATEDATPATPVAAPRKPALERQKAHIGEIVIDLLRAKLEASQALAVAVADPVWIKRQRAADLAVLGQWLDGTAFAIGDRLASAGDAEER